jgi:plasmid stabilization system protein ParE
MRVKWTRAASSDLVRLHDFLVPVAEKAAARAVQALSAAPDKLIEHPRLGEKFDEFAPREVRRILVGRYEIRYEIAGDMIYVLRLWHTREER